MHRGHFNVTSIVNRDKENVLAVLVHMPDTPLANRVVQPICLVADGIGCLMCRG